jgi:hypothetical protein
VQGGDAGAKFDVFDCELGGAGMCAAEELDVEIYGVDVRATWVGGLHVGASGDEEAGSGAAAVGDCCWVRWLW